jgi:ribosomal protein S18 acetylase RimI-like enzyme
MNLNIRQATINDLDTVTSIEEICFPKAEAATRESFEARLKAFDESFLVAELDGKMVGFINGSVINEKVILDEFYSDTSFHNPNGDYQSIFGLDVLPEYRARGIAAELVKALIEVARKAGRKGLTLCCKEQKIPYYSKLGFVDIGKSESEHGHAVWYNMVLLFDKTN